MNWLLLLRFLHIVSAIASVGGVFARQFVRTLASTVQDIHQFVALSNGAGVIERLMVIPGSLAVLIIGIIFALMLHAPILGFLQGASQNWLLLANVLLLVDILIVPLIFIPRGKQFEPLLRQSLTQGAITPALRAALDDPVVRMAHRYEMGSLIVIVALMVFRPF